MTGYDLAELLRGAGRNQSWLADALDVNRSTISRWVKGEINIPPLQAAQAEELLTAIPKNALDKRQLRQLIASEDYEGLIETLQPLLGD